MPALSMGTVIGGPANMVDGQIVVQPIAAKNSTFWQIKYDNGVTGWSGTLWVRDVSSDYGGVPAGTTPVTCDSFAFTPATVSKGASTTATWTTSGGGRVFLMNSSVNFEKEFKNENSYTFVPEQTGLYMIKVIGSNNTQATCVATITVRGSDSTTAAPACEYFKFTPANVKKGATATLSWKATNVTSVFLTNTLNDDAPEYSVEGSINFAAAKNVIYFLTGLTTEGKRKVLCSTTLVVQDVSTTATTPICNAFYFNPSPARLNATTTATWDTTNASKVILSSAFGGDIKSNLAADGSFIFVVKKAREMYTLTAVGTDGTRNSCNNLLLAS